MLRMGVRGKLLLGVVASALLSASLRLLRVALELSEGQGWWAWFSAPRVHTIIHIVPTHD